MWKGWEGLSVWQQVKVEEMGAVASTPHPQTAANDISWILKEMDLSGPEMCFFCWSGICY